MRRTAVPQIVYGNLLSIEEGILCHQVNCFRIGQGLALDIINKWPEVLRDFNDRVGNWRGERTELLGSVLYTAVGDNLLVASLFGQYNCGVGRQFTIYPALSKALRKAYTEGSDLGLNVYLPYRIGCNRGGGDWKEVLEIVEMNAPNAIIVRLPSS